MGLMISGIKPSGLIYNGDIIYKAEVKPSINIKPFSEASDEEISQYLDWHYAGKINIADYWKIGDTKLIHIDATNSGTQDHVAQDMTIVIYGFNHDDLATPINGNSKAAVTVGFREAMSNEGSDEYEYYSGEKSRPLETYVEDNNNYSNNSLRDWLNGSLLNALPSTFSSLIKEVNKKNLVYHTKTDDAPLITKDKIWLLSYPEVFGTAEYGSYIKNQAPENYEGEQYKYMILSNNRIKYNNNNGTANSKAILYWLRSPSSMSYNYVGYYWIVVHNNGTKYSGTCEDTRGLAPAFCL